MKQALISPNEPVSYNYVNPVQTGWRVAEVADQSFEIAPPMFWIECVDNVIADEYYYDNINGVINPIPSIPPAQDQPVTTGTQTL